MTWYSKLMQIAKAIGWKWHCMRLCLCERCGKGTHGPFMFGELHAKGRALYGVCECPKKRMTRMEAYRKGLHP